MSEVNENAPPQSPVGMPNPAIPAARLIAIETRSRRIIDLMYC
jgi:hypothetical protein